MSLSRQWAKLSFFTLRVKLHFCQIQSRFELTNVDIAMNTLSENKHIVARFNREVIEQGNMQAFNELVAADFVNHTTPPGTPNGHDGFAAFFTNILRPALPDLTVELHDQIAEGDKVVTRKTISGTHQGMFLGVPATGRRIRINVTDIVRIINGQYAEHWGNADLHGALAQMK